MRQDKIAERLERLEREVLTLKSEQRQGIDSMLSALVKFQDAMLEERMNSLREELHGRYRDIVLDSSMDKAERMLSGTLPDPCPRNMREKCMQAFMNGLRNAPGAIEDGNADENKLKALIGVAPCENCYRAYVTERDNIVRATEKMSKYRESLGPQGGILYMSQLPDEVVLSDIVEPLSHEARFKMLKGLFVRDMTYKELSEITGYDGGHLLYHLNKLMASGLVVRGDGGYMISERGRGVMALIKSLYEQ